MEDQQTSEVLYGGAAGGGKSWLGCLWQIHRRVTYPGTRGVIGRAKIRSLEESTLNTYFDVCSLLGYEAGVHYKYNQQKNFIQWWNGSRTVLKDLFLYPSDPDFKSLGSTEFTDAFIDEVTEVTVKAFDILRTRIRYKHDQYGLTPKILMTANPGPGWVKDRYIKKDDIPVELESYQRYVHAVVDDNPNEAFRDSYRRQLEQMISEYDKARLLYGDWDAAPKATNPFATHFDQSKHVSPIAVFQPNRAIYISLDFNLEPFGFIFQHKWRDKDGFHIHQFDEVKIDNGDIEQGIEAIRMKLKYYGASEHQLRITGDKMGDKRDFGRRDKASYYERIRSGLRLRSSQIETPPNPTHENSRQDLNYVLYHLDDFLIHPQCKESIYDLASVECDAFGKILKRDRKNLAQRADFLDCHRYACNDKFVQQWIQYDQKRRR